VTFRRSFKFALLATAIFALGLSGCGRRGPLELPPETQARGAALKAQQEAESQKRQATRGERSNPTADEPPPPTPGIPGTIGNRPPDQYPFPLDPLL